jgi:hypothetical protein
MPAPDVEPPYDSVGIRYVSPDGAEHIWTAGPGTIGHTVRLLRADDDGARVDVVRWTPDGWVETDANWIHGLTEEDEIRLRQYLIDLGEYDSDGPSCEYDSEPERSVEHRASL